MKRRRVVTPGQSRREGRFVITIAIVIGIVLAIAAYGYFTGAWETSPQTPTSESK